jgi:hypothetical protein
MDHLSPRWRKLVQNLGWYVLAVLVAIVLVRFERPLLWLPWMVAIIGAMWLLWWQLRDNSRSDGSQQASTYLEQTLLYQRQIEQALKASTAAANSRHTQQLMAQIENWTSAIQDLVQRINSLRQDELIQRDLKSVPEAIASLEARLGREADVATRAQLERTLANRRKQLAALKQLQNTVNRAEIQIENTLSLLGTIYSQILIGQSTSHVADYSRIALDVDEEVRQLQDQLEALREVKLGQSDL